MRRTSRNWWISCRRNCADGLTIKGREGEVGAGFVLLAEDRLHFGDDLGVIGRDVFGFSGVAGEVIEADMKINGGCFGRGIGLLLRRPWVEVGADALPL